MMIFDRVNVGSAPFPGMRKRRAMIKSSLVLVSMTLTVVCQELPLGSTGLFNGSGDCATCHMPGGPNPVALLNSSGQDISPPTFWRSTMMANSAKDPVWRAKVSAEIAANPQLQAVIEDKCTTCHAPIGRTQENFDTGSPYTMNAMIQDPLARDGVSCTVCHQIHDPGLSAGDDFSGHYSIDDSRVIYGPHANPIVGPMLNNLNYTPLYSQHTQHSELCATCHTLFTPYVDDAGEIAGEAPEQVPYLEWLNSSYPAQGIECQTCHMPEINETIPISNRPGWIGGRNPLHAHEFVGGNFYMQKILRQFRTELGLTTPPEELDSTYARTVRLLQDHTLDLAIEADWGNHGDSLFVHVLVSNLSGHKFPTAYPSRRAWIELLLHDGNGDTLFHSGGYDQLGEINGLDSVYEPHHLRIDDPDEVQIYQNIPSDINQEQTYTLLRIAGYLKDNRIPPLGYISTGPAADSTRIEGLAASDPDFNTLNDAEGSGSDQLTYAIAGLSPGIQYTVEVRVNYQSLAPRFVADLISYGTPEALAFADYYAAIPNLPLVLASESLQLLTSSLDDSGAILRDLFLINVFPNPFNAGVDLQLQVPTAGDLGITLFDVQGRQVGYYQVALSSSGPIHQHLDFTQALKQASSGVYILQVALRGESGSLEGSENRKVIYLK